MFDKKKDIGTAVSLGADGDTGDYDEDELLHSVSEELIDAIKGGDVKAVTMALRTFLSCVEAKDDQQDAQA